MMFGILSMGAGVSFGETGSLALEQVKTDGPQVESKLSVAPPEDLVLPPYLVWEADEMPVVSLTATTRRGGFWPDAEQSRPMAAERYFSGSENFLDAIGNYMDPQSVEWPLGTLTSVHFRPTADSGIGSIVPFLSVLQDVDEVDAHERDGLGAGLTYRFDASSRFDVELDYLDAAGGSSNPALTDEVRLTALFTINF
jgi:hypothetical protein